MSSRQFSPLRIRSLRLRAAIVLLIGAPCLWIGFEQAAGSLPIDRRFAVLAVWVSYGVLMWALIALAFGERFMWAALGTGVSLGLAVVLAGAALGNIEILRGSKTPELLSFSMALQFVVIAVVVPYSLSVVRSFPASEIVLDLSRYTGRRRKMASVLAVSSRAFEVVIATFHEFFSAWKEENPKVVAPRWSKGFSRLEGLRRRFQWFGQSLLLWAYAIFVKSVEGIPALVVEMERQR